MPHALHCGAARVAFRRRDRVDVRPACASAADEGAFSKMGDQKPMAATTNRPSVEHLTRANVGKLPEHIGLTNTEVAEGRVVGRFSAREDLVAHTGFLLAG